MTKKKRRTHIAVKNNRGVKKGGSRSTSSKPKVSPKISARRVVFGSKTKRNFAQKVFYYSFAIFWVFIVNLFTMWTLATIKKNQERRKHKYRDGLKVFFRTLFFIIFAVIYWVIAIIGYTTWLVVLSPLILLGLVGVLFYVIISLCRFTQSLVDRKVVGNGERLKRRYKDSGLPHHFFKLIDKEKTVKERKR